MELEHLLRLGYALVITTFILMIWVSLAGGKEFELVKYPPCYFNSLCSCSKSMPDLGIVHCQDVHLPRIPLSINVSKVYKLHLINTGLRTVEPYFLQSTGLYKIVISDNPLSFIPDEAFLGLERSLWELELSYNQLTTVPTRAMKYLQKLKYLDLKGNDIIRISPDNWKSLGHTLETLILAENSITHLPIDSFSGLPEVETIDLRGNNLQEIDPSVFRDGMNKLANLILSDNQLSSIPYQPVSLLKALKYLDLGYNRINKMQPASSEVGIQNINYNFQLNLDVLNLEYNQIRQLQPASFQYFNVLNKTYLDGNQLEDVQESAFRQAKIRELYMRFCGLTSISPTAFEGLENYLEILDLSGNNISLLPSDVFHRLQILRRLSLKDNRLTEFNPTTIFNGFQFTLIELDMTGISNVAVTVQDLRRLRSLREISVSKLFKNFLDPEDFAEFGVDLEELQLISSGLQTIKSNAFRHVHGLRKLDLSENSIATIENKAFQDIGHSLISLKMSNGLSSALQTLPSDALRDLINVEELDISNNKIRKMAETSFHFLKKLRRLELQDNNIEALEKGTFQGDIHSNLQDIYFSFNGIQSIKQHTFVDLPELEQILLDDNRIDKLERRSFMNLEHLKRLNLKGNKLVTVPAESFQNLPELEHLDISYNKLGAFNFSMFDQVGTLAVFNLNASHNKLKELTVGSTYESEFGSNGVHANVKILDLSHNNISSISRQFFKPAEMSLTHLYLSSNSLLNATMEVFGNMLHLQLLDISDNMLYELEFDTFRNTKELQVFHAAHNRIADIPNDLFRFLKHLRIVDFSSNRLRALPDNLFREEGIERLVLSHNMLGKLPLNCLSIGAAITLHELDLSWNSISSLSHGGILSRFKNLNWLDLSYNRLAQIDAGTFRDLPRLSSLELSHNSQLSLESNGLSFQGLEYTLLHLYMDNVSLAQVPTLPTPHLITLSLAYNYLPTVPPEMAANLSSLCRLNLNYNDLTSVPIVTHSLPELRYLYMAANPIIALSNTSLLGVKDHLKELDITGLDLTELEGGAFCKIFTLKTLKINFYSDIKNFNIPRILAYNSGLHSLMINVDESTDVNLEKEMAGELPQKLKNITFSGRGLKKLGANVLKGMRNPNLNFHLFNTSVTTITSAIFENAGLAKNITVDVRNNMVLKSLKNPSTGMKPNMYEKTFLIDLQMSGNQWTCNCDIGWVEVWERKRRQYLCAPGASQTSSFYNLDYTCRHADDDLRNSFCANKNNDSLIEVLKTEIECGWSSGTTIQISHRITFLAIFLTTICKVYISL